MRTQIAIAKALLEEAHALSGHRTKTAVVAEALREYVARRRQMGIVELFGTIDYASNHNYKTQRQWR